MVKNSYTCDIEISIDLTSQDQSRNLKSRYGARNRFQEPSLESSSQVTQATYDNPMPTWFLQPPTRDLKVHKIENFFVSDFGICVISLLVTVCINNKILGKKFFDWTILGGATIIPRSPRTTRNEKKFQDRPKKFLFLKSYMTLK